MNKISQKIERSTVLGNVTQTANIINDSELKNEISKFSEAANKKFLENNMEKPKEFASLEKEILKTNPDIKKIRNLWYGSINALPKLTDLAKSFEKIIDHFNQ
nr:hypothetical protein [uncultured Cohaesibacter sp.]